MKRLTSAICFSALLFSAAASAQDNPEWAIALHGGAGVIERGDMSPAMEAEYRAALEDALRLGAGQLEIGASALDAVEVTIRTMEDDPKFNSGKGAVFTAAGRNELDASIMDGETLNAGAVAGVTRVRHPITLARLVMTDSPHVMLAGSGAETFAEEAGAELVTPSHFFTERRWQSLLRALEEKGLPAPDRPEGVPAPEEETVDDAALDLMEREHKFGTVGVVAVDREGNIAAGTSTGGTTAKLWGRVGDSPIIGAGTYASNESCAVSGTGTGEYFIRLTVASAVCDHVKYKGEDIQTAADAVIHGDLTELGGDGGVVAMTPDGAVAFSFNTPGMYRGHLRAGEEPKVMIYGDED
ncbi:isoaspartyl peptidase/L-asparaginase family protein [Euryhalocaulis caribicus]|uniref:isoaspartyl peptidase/L-asparaginase family protein n=1 Tax=Euryhalocaulis caribicus TaxID=1161401 RepID=UPI0003A6ED55|nr:isoaspartyl peptidase/L-asparaginase [Euryhalocaulis caribicus]